MNKNSEITNSLEKLLNPNILRNNLTSISLFVMIFEFLKNSIEETVDNFFLIEYRINKNGKKEKIINDEYQKYVLSLISKKEQENKLYIKASILWLIKFNVLDKDDIGLYNELRIYRNDLTHEFHKYLIDYNYNFDENKTKLLIDLFRKLEKNWIMNVEITINPDFDNQNIKIENVNSPKILVLDLINTIIKGDNENYQF